MKYEVIGNSIDDVYDAILSLKSHYGRDNIIVNENDVIHVNSHRKSYINDNGFVDYKLTWGVFISFSDNIKLKSPRYNILNEMNNLFSEKSGVKLCG